MKNFIKYSQLEQYLFDEVRKNFHKNHFLTAEEFVCILIWKSNRSVKRIINKIKKRYPGKSFQLAVKELTNSIYKKDSPQAKLYFLINDRKRKKISIPLATSSAILTVLYPQYFTVYDSRVCSVLDKHKNLKNRENIDNIWKGYLEYKADVIKKAPLRLTLREKDKWLWGKSFYNELKEKCK